MGNCIAQDRADSGFAAKEVSKTMSDPAECDLLAVKRLGRYLTTFPMSLHLYRWQDGPKSIDCYSDSDWGGDLVTRRSTSGGCIFRGSHMVLHGSRTQQIVSLSSAEAELHALVKCASDGASCSQHDGRILRRIRFADLYR